MRAYTDIFANQARNNIQESLFDLGPDSPYNPFVQVLPSVEDGLSPQSTCRPIPGFTFSLGDGIAGDKVDNLSVVTNPDGTATTKDQANELDSNGQPTGRKIAGAIVYKLTKDQMQRAFNGQSLWVQQGTTTDPLNTATFGNKLRLRRVALRGRQPQRRQRRVRQVPRRRPQRLLLRLRRQPRSSTGHDQSPGSTRRGYQHPDVPLRGQRLLQPRRDVRPHRQRQLPGR